MADATDVITKHLGKQPQNVLYRQDFIQIQSKLLSSPFNYDLNCAITIIDNVTHYLDKIWDIHAPNTRLWISKARRYIKLSIEIIERYQVNNWTVSKAGPFNITASFNLRMASCEIQELDDYSDMFVRSTSRAVIMVLENLAAAIGDIEAPHYGRYAKRGRLA